MRQPCWHSSRKSVAILAVIPLVVPSFYLHRTNDLAILSHFVGLCHSLWQECAKIAIPWRATMAEAIGVASGLVALSTFAYQSSVVLYTLVASFQAHQPRVRDLAEETHALAEVLKSLVEVARAKPDLQIPALEFPLKRCTKACEEFRDEIKKFSSRSKGAGKTSFRDWARLRYMGEDVDGFRRLLSDYKMTINIALTNATLYVVGFPSTSSSHVADMERFVSCHSSF